MKAKLALMIIVIVTLLFLTKLSLLSTFFWNLGLVHWMKAISLENRSRAFHQAIHWWEQSLLWAEDRNETLLYLGGAYERVGKKQQALETWQKLSEPTEILLTEGHLWLDNDLYQFAVPWFRGATLVSPQSRDSWYYMAQALARSGHPDRALLMLDKALKVENSSRILVSQVYFSKCYIQQMLLEPPELENALSTCQEALETGDFPSPKFEAEVHYRMCSILWWQKATPDLWINECQAAIALNPEYLLARYVLGIAYYNKYNDVRRAEQEFMKAMNIDPRSPWGPLMLGEHVYLPAGMREEAREAYEWALRIDPNFGPAKRALERLEQ